MQNFNNRETILPKNSEFVTRWSPRSFDKSYKISEREVKECLEAARWSYSSRNLQPWRFIYGKNGDKTFNIIFNSLVEFNQNWAKNCCCLIAVITTKENEKDNFFDCGAAAMSLSLQAQKLGLHTHLIGGFDRLKIQQKIGENYTPVTIIAIGKMGVAANLDEFNQAREVLSGRKSLDQISFNSFDGLK